MGTGIELATLPWPAAQIDQYARRPSHYARRFSSAYSAFGAVSETVLARGHPKLFAVTVCDH
jgi:hypothetical protein